MRAYNARCKAIYVLDCTPSSYLFFLLAICYKACPSILCRDCRQGDLDYRMVLGCAAGTETVMKRHGRGCRVRNAWKGRRKGGPQDTPREFMKAGCFRSVIVGRNTREI